MKEIFFGKQYSSYFDKNEGKFKKWTSKIKKILGSHKLIISMLIIIVSCFSINIWLINRFINILQYSAKF